MGTRERIPPGLALRQILAIAGKALREARSRRVFWVLFLAGALAVASTPFLPADPTPQGRLRLVLSVSLAVTGATGLLVALLLSATAIPGELRARTIFALAARPVGRLVHLAGAYLGVLAVLGVLLAGLGGLTFLFAHAIAWREGRRDGGKGSDLAAEVLQPRRTLAPQREEVLRARAPGWTDVSTLRTPRSEKRPEGGPVRGVLLSPDEAYRWRFRLPAGGLRGGEALPLRVELRADPAGHFAVALDALDPASGEYRVLEAALRLGGGGSRFLFLDPRLVGSEGAVELRLRNDWFEPVEEDAPAEMLLAPGSCVRAGELLTARSGGLVEPARDAPGGRFLGVAAADAGTPAGGPAGWPPALVGVRRGGIERLRYRGGPIEQARVGQAVCLLGPDSAGPAEATVGRVPCGRIARVVPPGEVDVDLSPATADRPRVLVLRGEALAVALPEESFGLSLAKSFLLLFARLAFLAAATMAVSTFCSFPVAAVFGGTLAFAAFTHVYLGEWLSAPAPAASSAAAEEKGSEEPGEHVGEHAEAPGGRLGEALERIGRGALDGGGRVLARVVPDFDAYSGTGALLEGRAIPSRLVGEAFLWLVLVRGGIFAVLAGLVYPCRQLGADA